MKAGQTSQLGIWSFVLSLFPVVATVLYLPYWHLIVIWAPVVSMTMGGVCLRRIKMSQGQIRGKGWATTGILLSLLSLVAFFGLIAFFKTTHHAVQ